MTRHSSRTTFSENRSFATVVTDENVTLAASVNENVSVASTKTVTSYSTSEDPMAVVNCTVFISHAGEDKDTIAIPLRNKLCKRGITAFVDDCDIPRGADANLTLFNAMNTAKIAVIVLSPEFIAKEWTIRELTYLLKRRKECITQGITPPIIIPLFYRISIAELYNEPRLDRIDQNGKSLYESSRFLQRQRNGNPEANIRRIRKALDMIRGIMGVENVYGVTNESSHKMCMKRRALLNDLCKHVCKAEKDIRTRAKTQEKRSTEAQRSCHPRRAGQTIASQKTKETLKIEREYEYKEASDSSSMFTERSISVQQTEKREIRTTCERCGKVKRQFYGKVEMYVCRK